LSFRGEVFLLGFLGSVFGAALFSVLNAYRIQGATDDVIPNAWEVFDPSSANEHYRVLLKVVTNSGNVGGHFNSIGQSHSGNLPKGGIRFFGSGSIDSYTDPSFLRRSRKCGC
jgi:hypothetical protein